MLLTDDDDDDDDRYVNDDEGIFILLLFFLYFIYLYLASFLAAYLYASIWFLNSTIHDMGPEI